MRNRATWTNNADFRHVSQNAARPMHWLGVLPNMNVPISASERQSSWVLGAVHQGKSNRGLSRENVIDFPHDLFRVCCVIEH